MTVYIECPVCAAVVRTFRESGLILRHGCQASPCPAAKLTEQEAAHLPRNEFLRKLHLNNRRDEIARLSIGSLSVGQFDKPHRVETPACGECGGPTTDGPHTPADCADFTGDHGGT